MPRHKLTDNGSKLADLQSEAAVFPRCHAQGVFIEADSSATITRIKATIESRLGKEVNLRPDLGVEKKRQTSVEEIVDPAVNESRCRLLEMITFEVDRTAQSGPKIILKRRKRERAVESIKKIFDFKSASAAGEESESESSQQLHMNFNQLNPAQVAPWESAPQTQSNRSQNTPVLYGHRVAVPVRAPNSAQVHGLKFQKLSRRGETVRKCAVGRRVGSGGQCCRWLAQRNQNSVVR